MPLNVFFQNQEPRNCLLVEFGKTLHDRGGDWALFKNVYDKAKGNVFEPSDSLLLKLIVTALMQNDAGVERVIITPYGLMITFSRATPIEDIEARVLGAIHRSNTTPVRV